MDELIAALLPLIPELRDKDVVIERLEGGLTNRNYRIETADREVFVLRLPGADTELLGIDRQSEAACARAAAAAGVGPEVVGFIPEHSALVTRFVAGRLLTSLDARQPDMMRRVAEAVRRVHEQPAPPGLGAFSPFATVRSYHALAGDRNVPFPRDLARALQVLARIEQALQTDEPPSLCHNDLLPNNFIDDGTAIRIIDWEYAARGDRFFDLGNLAVNHQLHEEQEQELLRWYFGMVRPDHLRRLRLMRLASDMREAMWGYLQAGISRLHTPGYYLDYGRHHLDRFLAGSANLAEGAR